MRLIEARATQHRSRKAEVTGGVPKMTVVGKMRRSFGAATRARV